MTNESKSKDWRDNVKPLGFLPSLRYFGLPALLFVAGFWVLMPWFIQLGMLPYYAYLLGLGIPLALLWVTALLWLKLEGYTITWATVKARFRLRRMDRKAWLWSMGALLAGSVVGALLISQLSRFLIEQGIIPVPSTIPAFMSPTSLTDPRTAYDEAVGDLRDNWLPLISMAILLVINVLGEEFWWRGIVLPRQEMVFGRWTWVVHGIMWAFFHIFKWWDVLTLIPICLALSFVCSKLKNTTPGIVIHSVTNGIALLPLFAGILGWI
jgi:membrane protease YdiL (CAAX protease family)